MAASKLTIDLTEKNRETLERIKSEQRCPYGTTINNLVDTFCNIPDSVKKELLSYIKPKIRNLYREMDGAGDFNFREISDKAQAYMDIATFLNDGKRLSINTIDTTTTMVKYPMRSGYLICPDNWIIVNPEEASKSGNAFVIECRNAGEFGIPHLLVFSNYASVNEHSDVYRHIVLCDCCKAYPKFSEILDLQVAPIDDPDNPGDTLNAEEWLNAPNACFYDIFIQGTSTLPIGYEPVLGARIVKTIIED